jgi:hypothetical protein
VTLCEDAAASTLHETLLSYRFAITLSAFGERARVFHVSDGDLIMKKISALALVAALAAATAGWAFADTRPPAPGPLAVEPGKGLDPKLVEDARNERDRQCCDDQGGGDALVVQNEHECRGPDDEHKNQKCKGVSP